MDHVTFLKSMPADRRLALTERSDTAGLRHLALHLGAIGFVSTGIVTQVPFWPFLLLIQGVLLSFLFTLAHECTHQTPFRSRWINEVVGHFASGAVAMPFTWFRHFHMAHHKFTNDPDRDPELAGGPRPQTWLQFALYLSGWSYWTGNARALWSLAFGQLDALYLPARQMPKMRRDARVLLGLFALALFSLLVSPLVLWLWLVPLLLGQPVLRLYLLAEHGRCPAVANMLENSRTTYTTALVRALAWNMPYHAEHHAFPTVPFHKLPEFHRDVQAHLKSTSEGYGAFAKAYAQNLS